MSALIGLQQHMPHVELMYTQKQVQWHHYMCRIKGSHVDRLHVCTCTCIMCMCRNAFAFWRYQLILCSSTGEHTVQVHINKYMYMYTTVFEWIVVWYQSTDPDVRLNRQTLTTWHSTSSQSKQHHSSNHTHTSRYVHQPPSPHVLGKHTIRYTITFKKWDE